MSISLPKRFTRIDETSFNQHYCLTVEDSCIYYGEYFAYSGYKVGGTNQLISNYKTKPTDITKDPRRHKYKQQAIQHIAQNLRNTITQDSIESYTWVPIPTSKTSDHPDYDDRLVATLRLAFSGFEADVREILQQTTSTEADHHSGGSRISADELSKILRVDQKILAASSIRANGIALFDDVLTSGKHFKCCSKTLAGHLPGVPIHGVFIARCVHRNAFQNHSF